MHQADELLTTSSVAPYLIDRGFRIPTAARVVELAGGVSNVVIAVETSDGDVVVKQSLARLNVPEEWLAPRERLESEAWALRLARQLRTTNTPEVLDLDVDRHVLTIERAPMDWSDWKTRLMTDHIEPATFRQVGEFLHAWHSQRIEGLELPATVTDPSTFRALRTDPYLRSVARSHPEVRERLEDVATRLETDRSHLIHGDFSPKNVLVGAGGLWVIDFEVTTLGDPGFDVAFLLCHLVMKAVHLTTARERLWAGAREFQQAYHGPDDCDPAVTRWTLRLLGALLVARVKGQSRAEYLNDGDRARIWTLGEALLDGRVGTWDELEILEAETP